MQNLKVNSVFIVALLSLVVSCKKNSFNSKEDLLTFLHNEANGYVHHKTINGVDFTLTYRPIDLLVEQELGGNIDKSNIQISREKYRDYIYFNLSISRSDQELLNAAAENRNKFGAMVNQLAFGMNDKVHLFTKSKDTLEIIDFVYPRMYGMSRSTSMMFVFLRSEDHLDEDYLNFTIEDLGFSTGEVKFKINTKKIKNEPTIY